MSDTPISPTSTAVALLPSWDAALPKTAGLFGLGDGIPAVWQPRPEAYDPKAIPTPFARAEATRLVLAQLDKAPDHELALRFRWLLLGVASGVLTLDPDDLGAPDFDNLGRALLQVDPGARYFAHVRWRRGALSLPFGVTYRSSLFSPHARRSAEDWDALAHAIKPLEPDALAVLADWRAVLVDARRWNPTLPGCEWQAGVDELLRRSNVAPSEGHRRLHEDARFVGPVWLMLPTGLSDEPVRPGPLYLPSLLPGWAARFVSTCQFRPREDAAAGAVVWSDASGKPVGRVRLPRAGADTNPLAIGMGLLELPDVPRVQAGAADLWITGRGGEPGLVELLRPLVLVLQKLGRPVDATHVLACPPLYPDPVRILFERGRWPGSDGARLAQSRRMTAALMQWGGRAIDAAALERAHGEQVQLGGQTPILITLADRVGEAAINDFRALGFVLWSVFVREAEVAAPLEGQIAMSDTLEKLLEHAPDRPLEPRPWVYDLVERAAPERLGRRVATLQRFVKAYRTSSAGLDKVLERSAQSFARWVVGHGDIVPLGRAPARFVPYRLPTGEELRLALDAYEV